VDSNLFFKVRCQIGDEPLQLNL